MNFGDLFSSELRWLDAAQKALEGTNPIDSGLAEQIRIRHIADLKTRIDGLEREKATMLERLEQAIDEARDELARLETAPIIPTTSDDADKRRKRRAPPHK